MAARYYYSISFTRVWREFERWRRKDQRSSSVFLQRVVGVVETDLGRGIVVAAERCGKGRYAPTLRELAARGEVDGKIQAAFDHFCSKVELADIVVSDLNPRNIVYAVDPHGRAHFVLIDGTGDDTLIPVLRMSSALNRIAKKRKIAGLRRKVERLSPRASRSNLPGLSEGFVRDEDAEARWRSRPARSQETRKSGC